MVDKIKGDISYIFFVFLVERTVFPNALKFILTIFGKGILPKICVPHVSFNFFVANTFLFVPFT
mgnify:CR=1 FL=1